MNKSPYKTEGERLEARRASFRASKQRAKMKKEERKSYIEDLLERVLNSRSGPPWRRDLIIEAEARRRGGE